MMEEAKKGRCSAGPLTFAVRHELWLPLEPTPNLGAAS
jgi:hypothetical protein